jgi:inorganic pyrophosphatase
MGKGFTTAFKASLGIGFATISLGVLSLALVAASYLSSYITEESTTQDYSDICLYLAGYALGASLVGLFGRVGGSIFAKAADVGVDLTKNEESESNPGAVADYIGDNVGEAIGISSELFAAFSEIICATMILSCYAPEILSAHGTIYFPIMIFSCGIIVSMISVLIATKKNPKSTKQMEENLNSQPLSAALWMTPILFILCIYLLPSQIQLVGEDYIITRFKLSIVALFGLWGGYLIGKSSEIFTSYEYHNIDDLARSCHTGSATDIIYGLALGYMSTILPVVVLIIVIYIAYIFASMYGIAIAACGMFCTLSILISVASYSSIANNATGLSKMSDISYVSIRAEDIHAAGKSISAHVKCVEIGGASIIALAIFGAFIMRLELTVVDLLRPIEFAGLIIGAMIPYVFSSQILETIGKSTGVLKTEIERQMAAGKSSSQPDYHKCIRLCVSTSLKGMAGLCSIAIFTPLVAGLFFGPVSICGLLAGMIVAGVQIGTAAVNAGTAWDSASKYIEGKVML